MSASSALGRERGAASQSLERASVKPAQERDYGSEVQKPPGYSCSGKRSTTCRSDDVFEISHDLAAYEVVDDIGRGQFGVVQKIRLKNQGNGKLLVWKRIPYSPMQEAEKRQLTHEVQLLQALSHTNVVRYLGKINDKVNSILYLIMEYCDGGDLARYLAYTVKKGHYLPEYLVLTWFRQLVDALHYCHSRHDGKVLHRDLKPQNILLSGPYKKIKLADFGLAKMLQPSQLMAQSHVGTPYYMSPEVLYRSQYDEKSDIWSLGCLLYEIATGLSPFSRATSYEDLCKLVDSGSFEGVEFPTIYDPELLHMIRWMLSNSERPTTTELRETLLYKWATALRYKDLSAFFRNIIQEQKQQLEAQAKEIHRLKFRLAATASDFKFIEDYIHFQQQSDNAIRRSLKLISPTLKASTEPLPHT